MLSKVRHTYFLVMILPKCYRNYYTKLEIDRAILTSIAIRYGCTYKQRADINFRKATLLKIGNHDTQV